MLKSIITSFLVLVSSALCTYAQEDVGSISMPYGRSLQLSMAAGCNFSLAGDVDQWWFGDRQARAFELDWMVSYMFPGHWGVYADLRLKFFRLRDAQEGLAEDIFDTFFPGLRRLHPSFSVGGVYRYEYGRWGIYPRIGIGWQSYGYRESTKDSGAWEFRRRTSTMTLNAGMTGAFRLSRRISFILDMHFQQPLQKSKATLTEIRSGEEIRTVRWTSSLGRELTLSCGIRLHLCE